MQTTLKNSKTKPLVKESVSITLLFSDVIAMSMSFILALLTAQFLKDLFLPEIYNKPLYDYRYINDLFFIWMTPAILAVFFVKGHYTQRVPWWSQVQHVLIICLIALIVDGFTRLALNMSFSRSLVGLSWIYVFLFTLLGRQIIHHIAVKKNIWRIPTIVIGDISTVTDILFAFHADNYTGYDVKNISLRDREDRVFNLSSIPARYKDIEITKKTTDFRKYIKDNKDCFFVISLETFRGQERDELINTLTELKTLYAIVPPISRISLYEMEPRYFFGNDVMLLHAKHTIFSPLGRFLKRGIDITLALIALIGLLPIVIAVSAFLKLEGQGGSVFYGGYRVGRNGKKFKCWKFRSMEPDSDHLLQELLDKDPQAKADWEEFHKLKQADPRVTTKTARIIRKASIDELPQLWNVIKGDMSLVGPRPILENEIEQFGVAINQYYKTRPGITGLWQVSGRNDTSFERRIYWDSWYVRNWSVWGDIVIMIKTLRVITGASGAY